MPGAWGMKLLGATGRNQPQSFQPISQIRGGDALARNLRIGKLQKSNRRCFGCVVRKGGPLRSGTILYLLQFTYFFGRL